MSEDALRAEIDRLMEQVMASLGSGTMMIPDEIQRGMTEQGNPLLDEAGLIRLRDDLRAQAPYDVACGSPRGAEDYARAAASILNGCRPAGGSSPRACTRWWRRVLMPV